MKTIQIREYGTFVVGEKNGSNVGGNITLTKRTFEQLENFILSNSSKETDALELMGLSARRGVGKIITAKNFVGIIINIIYLKLKVSSLFPSCIKFCIFSH